MSINSNSRPDRVVFLDWLRIFAFASVLIGHKFYANLIILSNDDSVHATLRLVIKALLPLVMRGGAGVVVFFLISGYIVLHVLQSAQPLDFFVKRIFRIYPLYVFAVLLHYSVIVFVQHGSIPFKILIPQLLLIGDFFNTPHTLGGVEWTLRVEILFYLYMFFMSYFKLTSQFKSALPWVFLVTVVLIGNLPTFPDQLWNAGYFNIYSPFLFLGAMFWLYENRYIGLNFLGMFAAVVFLQHWHLVAVLTPSWRYAHFSALAAVLFLMAWALRKQFIFNKTAFFFSELTYAVYLTHSWFFDYVKMGLDSYEIAHSGLYAVAVLLLFSAALVRLIEKPGIKLGHKFINQLKKYDYRQAFKRAPYLEQA